MGFNLDMFFKELLEVLDNSAKHEAGDASGDLRMIEQLVKNGQQYARECGFIPKDV